MPKPPPHIAMDHKLRTEAMQLRIRELIQNEYERAEHTFSITHKGKSIAGSPLVADSELLQALESHDSISKSLTSELTEPHVSFNIILYYERKELWQNDIANFDCVTYADFCKIYVQQVAMLSLAGLFGADDMATWYRRAASCFASALLAHCTPENSFNSWTNFKYNRFTLTTIQDADLEEPPQAQVARCQLLSGLAIRVSLEFYDSISSDDPPDEL